MRWFSAVSMFNPAFQSHTFYSASVGVRSIVINPSVCVSLCLCVREHISGTARPILAKFCTQIPCGRGSVLLRRRCATLCTSGFMDDATFGRNVEAGRLRDCHERRGDTEAETDVYEYLFYFIFGEISLPKCSAPYWSNPPFLIF